MSFIFGGDTGMTYEQIQARRRIAEEMAKAGSGRPRNVGEGIHSAASSIASALMMRQAGEADRALQERMAAEQAAAEQAAAAASAPQPYASPEEIAAALGMGGAPQPASSPAFDAMAQYGGPTKMAAAAAFPRS